VYGGVGPLLCRFVVGCSILFVSCVLCVKIVHDIRRLCSTFHIVTIVVIKCRCLLCEPKLRMCERGQRHLGMQPKMITQLLNTRRSIGNLLLNAPVVVLQKVLQVLWASGVYKGAGYQGGWGDVVAVAMWQNDIVEIGARHALELVSAAYFAGILPPLPLSRRFGYVCEGHGMLVKGFGVTVKGFGVTVKGRGVTVKSLLYPCKASAHVLA
jgi:hypothetical protein